ncbi:MAG: threonine synthase, partial [Lachnospiraceae bacterium]|nr:threonine synthase [Lachnospiraceae bacterium]
MVDITYSSTRGADEKLKASEAILNGLASDGGLYVPDHVPALDRSLKEL